MTTLSHTLAGRSQSPGVSRSDPFSFAASSPVSRKLMRVAPDVVGLQTVMVNLFFVGSPDRWILVDAGLPMQSGRILSAAQQWFGRGAAPRAIVLTHGHFDHVGALPYLADYWGVPIYAHRMELPYITGQADYPPPDPTVGGGAFARLSPLYPRHAYDFRPRVRALPEDGTVPEMPDWRWIFTPGHSPGHVSLWRESDRTLIAGDAFVTQQQESFWGVMTNAKKIHGPPMYFTHDWYQAHDSVMTLEALQPNAAGTGHGLPMRGQELRESLRDLALHFYDRAVPKHGRYVDRPAVFDRRGVVSVPPPVSDPVTKIGIGVAAGALIAGVALAASRRERD